MNKIILIGNLTRDPELRVTPNGVSVCGFGLAVNRRKTSEGQPACDFFNVTAWRQLGEHCAKYLRKGRKACVIGQVQLREYTASDGARRTAVDIIADEVEFLSPAQPQDVPDAQTAPDAGLPGAPQESAFTPVDDELPF